MLNRYVLMVYSNPGTPPCEMICDTMEAALALKAMLTEADRIEFERVSGAE